MNTTDLPWLADVTKSCPVCGTIFKSPKWHNKKYCNLKCSRRAKHMRSLHKEYDRLNTGASEFIPNRQFFLDKPNPTTEQLNEMARLVAMELTDGLPCRFTGVVPADWIAPEGIYFVKQQKLDEKAPDEWLMLHPSMVE